MITDDQGNVRMEQYTYDKLSRLTDVDYGDGEVQQYTFDPMDNRLSKTVSGVAEGYTYTNANRFLTRGAVAYDNNQNGYSLDGGADKRLMLCYAWPNLAFDNVSR